jgi:hypothetical protein
VFQLSRDGRDLRPASQGEKTVEKQFENFCSEIKKKMLRIHNGNSASFHFLPPVKAP